MTVSNCGSIDQGHEWFNLVMTLEKDEIFLCLAAQDQDIDQVLLHEIIFFAQ